MRLDSHHQHAPSKHKEQQNHQRSADETRFLTNDGENEIVVRFRKISPFFSGIADPNAQQASGSHGVFAMHHLIADTLHISCGTSLICSHDAVKSVRTADNKTADQSQTATCHNSQPFARKISQQQRGSRNRKENHGRTKILAAHNQQQCKTKPRNQPAICIDRPHLTYPLLRANQLPRQPYA